MILRHVGLSLFILLNITNSTAQRVVIEKMEGTYVGSFHSPDSAGTYENFELIVSKINDSTIHVAGKTPGISTEFDAYVVNDQGVYRLKIMDTFMSNNGSFSPQTNRLSIAYHRGGQDPRNMEIFSGTKSN